MEESRIIDSAETAAIVLAVIVSFLTACSLTLKLIEKAFLRYHLWIRRKRIRGLLIQPTLEEIAVYGAQEPQRIDKDEQYFLNETRKINFDYLEKMNIKAQGRILLLCLIFSIYFFVISLEYLALALHWR